MKDGEEFLQAFVEVVEKALAEGDDVALVGFGTFSVAERSARIGRNFKTGKAIQVPASKTVKFKPGKNLKDAVR
jgi:DNA-binding protein HU-beta